MAIYTKKGDKGTTSLMGGARVSKSIVRLEVLGCLDEANSIIGLLRSKLDSQKDQVNMVNEIDAVLRQIQMDLLRLGADIGTPYSASSTFQKKIERISSALTLELEKHIDDMDSKLPVLKYFILPGGSEIASTAQIARACVRRAERNAVRLNKGAKVNPNILTYLNRLSDYLFVLSRFLNQAADVEEEIWK